MIMPSTFLTMTPSSIPPPSSTVSSALSSEHRVVRWVQVADFAVALSSFNRAISVISSSFRAGSTAVTQRYKLRLKEKA